MNISKIWIEEGCNACGLCVEICPEVFKMNDLASVIEDANYADHHDKIKEAAKRCPVEVIRYIE
jgi:ferredoxin